MEPVFVCIVLLIVVALVGHLIWLGVAKLCELVSGGKQIQFACEMCGHRVTGYPCKRCGYRPQRQTAPVDRRTIAYEELLRLASERKIDHETFARVRDALNIPTATVQTSAAMPPRPRNGQSSLMTAPQATGLHPEFTPALPPPLPEAMLAPQTVTPAAPGAPVPPATPATSPLADQVIWPAAEIPAARPGVPHPTAPVTVAPRAPLPPQPKAPRVPPAAPQPPRQTLSAFMEQRNIRWGELLGGLLIVGCSVALVITLWSKIAQYALLKFGLFTAVVAALFGIGLYAEHKWKLPTTSRGILLIGMLLVPLQFVAMAAMSGGASAAGTILGETLSAGIVLYLATLACRVLTPTWPKTVAVGLVLTAAGVLLTAQSPAGAAQARSLLIFGLAPLVVYLAATGWVIRASSKLARWEPAQSQSLAQSVGILFYAVAAAMVFLLVHFGILPDLWRLVSPLVLLVALPPMAMGMLMSTRMTDTKAVSWQIAGTAIAISAIGMVALSVLLAWPHPGFVVPMAMAAAVAVAAGALLFEMPWAHVPAGLLLGLASILGMAWLRSAVAADSDTAAVVAVILGRDTGWMLTIYALLAGAIAALLLRSRMPRHALGWGIVAAIAAVASLWYVIFYSYFVDEPIRWGGAALALYATLTFVAHWKTRRIDLGLAAWILLIPTLQRLLISTPHPWVCTFQDVAALALLAAIWLRPKHDWWLFSGRLAWHISFVAACVTALLAVNVLPHTQWSQQITWFVSLAAILLIASVLEPAPHMLVAGQIALAVAAVATGMWYGQNHPQATLAARWLIPQTDVRPGGTITVDLPDLMRFGKPILLALAILGVAWTSLRLLLANARGKAAATLQHPFVADRIITLLTLIALLLVFIGNPLLTSISHELGQAGRPWLAGDAVPVGSAQADGPVTEMAATLAGAASAGTWLILGLLAVWTFLEMWSTRRWGWLAGLLATGLGACGLIAISCDPISASASTLRWALMVLMVLASTPVWLRGWLGAATAGTGITRFASWNGAAVRLIRACLLLPTVLGILAITLIAAGLNLTGNHVVGPADGSFFAHVGNSLSYLIPLVAIIMTLLVYGVREGMQGLILAAAGTAHLAVTLGYLLSPDQTAGLFVLVRLMELNAATAAVFALAWSGWEIVHGRRDLPEGVRILAWVSAGLIAPWMVLGQAWIALSALSRHAIPPLFGLPAAWLAVAGAAVIFWLLAGRRIRLRWLGAVTFSAIGLVAFATSRAGLPWLEFHVMLGGYLAAGWFFLLLAERLMQTHTDEAQLAEALPPGAVLPADGPRVLSYASAPRLADPVSRGQIERRQQGIRGWIVAFAIVAAVLSLLSLTGGPQQPWWTIGGLFAVDMLFVAVAWRHLRPGYLYPATVAFNLAVSIWWAWSGRTLSGHHWLADLVHLNALCLAGSGGVAMVLERLIFLPELEIGRLWRGRIPALPLQRLAGIVLTLLAVVSAGSVVLTQGWFPERQTMWLTWGAMLATLALLVSLFWDKGSRLGLSLLYVSAFSAVSMIAGSVGLHGGVVFYLLLVLWCAFSVLCLYLSRNLQWVGRLGGELAPDDLRQILGLNWIVLGLSVLGVPLAELVELARTGQVLAITGPLIGAYLVIATFTIYVLLLAAIKPQRLSLTLSDPQRMGCVYAAEAMAAILFLHLRLTMPWLFGGFFLQYWPLVVMGIAFAGVAGSEISRRAGIRVLAEPLEKTGALLPLLPVLGFWMLASNVDLGVLLFSVGVLYGILASMRKSFGFALLAALALNGGLWRLLHDTAGLSFFEHPQLWLIPLALSILVAAYLNRQRLPAEHFAMIRMVCLIGVYISSTADIFINGVAQQPYLPLVLGGLSIAGALVGIWQRIRSLLYMGAGFLVLSILTVIYHAWWNLHQTWIIWLAGIACGAGILAIFAMFEKKRAEVEAVLGRLRQWEK